MKGLVFRVLIFTHRWVGVTIGLLMLLWCLSGFVMMYMPYPEPEQAVVNHGLKPLNNAQCCVFPEAAVLPDSVPVAGYSLQKMGERSTLRLDFDFGRIALFDLTNGLRPDINQVLALEVARQFAQANGITAKSLQAQVIDHDQWTIYGSYAAHRPLYRIDLHDPDDTVVYVSGTEGRVVQFTRAGQRFWNWLGAVPHWLYFQQLRQHPLLWTRVVVWTSAAGCFLAVFGLWLGIWQMRRKANGELSSPYRGVKWWHHIPGIVFGVFVLTWVLSGLLSMQPWGWLETHADDDAALLRGELPSWQQLRPVLERLPQARLPANTVSIEAAFFGGRIYSVATTRSGQRQRFDASWNPVSLNNAELAAAGKMLSAQPNSVSWQLLAAEDFYYYSHGSSKIALPVIKMTVQGQPATRYYYLDAVSGGLLNKVDGNARAYRWLHFGLHRWDFPLLRARPIWDLVVWLLLGGATLVTATGAYLGIRRLVRI